MDYIIEFIIAICWLLLGYIFGYLNGSKKEIKEFIDETGRTIRIEAKKLVSPNTPTGRIKPVTAEEAYKRQLNPQRQEALEETKKTLDTIPELVQAKELAQAMRKEQYGT